MRNLLTSIAFLSIAICSFAQKQNPKTDSVLVEYYQSQRYLEASAYLVKTYPEPVTNTRIITQLAYAANMANKLPEAEGYYQRLYATDSTSIPVLFNLAAINSRRGKKPKAAEYYKRILLIDSTNFNVYKQLALLTGDIPTQIEYLQKANSINPEDPNVAADLATLLINLRLNKQAERVIDIALKTDTANMVLMHGKAQVTYAQAKYPETIEICKRLIANFDRSSQVIAYKGVSEFNLKRYKDCIATFALLDSAGLASETGFYYTGISYKALQDNNMAAFYLQKAIKEGISPNTDTYYNEMADTFEKMHLPKKAVAAYQRGLTFSEKPLALYALASVYDTGLKDTINAIKYYRRYLKSKPSAEKQRSYIEYTSRRITDLSR